VTTIATNDDNDEIESQQHDVNNEEMLKRLINTAMATRKTNATNTFLENLPTSLINNNVAASLANLLGQLTNKQLIQQQQQQFQTEKAPLIKRYKCSLCSHISAWGGKQQKILFLTRNNSLIISLN
jgi:signal recognition particle GTPase